MAFFVFNVFSQIFTTSKLVIWFNWSFIRVQRMVKEMTSGDIKRGTITKRQWRKSMFADARVSEVLVQSQEKDQPPSL